MVDGRIGLGISGKIIDLMAAARGGVLVMDLYQVLPIWELHLPTLFL